MISQVFPNRRRLEISHLKFVVILLRTSLIIVQMYKPKS